MIIGGVPVGGTFGRTDGGSGAIGGVFGRTEGGRAGPGGSMRFEDPVTGMQVVPTDVASAVRQARTGGRFGVCVLLS